ncbi:MAG: hypothetical protein RLZZ165_1710 [Bacteroidota bacterium]
MQSQVDRKSEKVRTAANIQPEGSSHGGSTFQFVDSRPKVFIQRMLQEAANNSPQVQRLAQLKSAANSGARPALEAMPAQVPKRD